MPRGGARTGAGRKPLPPELKARCHTVKMNALEYAIYKREGGGKTLRAMIQKDYFVMNFENVYVRGVEKPENKVHHLSSELIV